MQRRAGGGLDVSFALVLAHDDVDFTEVVASRKDLRIPLLAVPSQSKAAARQHRCLPSSTAICWHAYDVVATTRLGGKTGRGTASGGRPD